MLVGRRKLGTEIQYNLRPNLTDLTRLLVIQEAEGQVKTTVINS